jgi:hypothetical protein
MEMTDTSVDPIVLSRLMEQVSGDDWSARRRAIEELGRYRGAAAAVAPTLLQMVRRDPDDGDLSLAFWRIARHPASLRGLIAQFRRSKGPLWLPSLGPELIYELLDALVAIGPDAAVAGPELMKLQAVLQHELNQGRPYYWAPVLDATAQTITRFRVLQFRVEFDDPYFGVRVSWPGTTVAFRPRPLGPPTPPPYSVGRTGAAMSGPYANEYFDDFGGPEAPGVIEAATAMGIPLDETRYAVFLRYAEHPANDGYLTQLQILTEAALPEALGDEALWDFPEQPATIAMLLEGFVEQQRREWSAEALQGLFESDPDEQADLGFGLRLEHMDGQMFRIWSRGWLHPEF